MVNFLVCLDFVLLFVANCDLVDDVESIFHLPQLLYIFGNLF